jgi:hypothetical protein
MTENTILTADDVRGSARLRSLGVMPGDEITAERKLVRKVSTEPVPQNKQITLEDLRGSARLRSLGVMPGDEITPDRKLVRKFSIEPDKPVEDVSSEDRSFFDNFMYGFDEAGTMTGYLADVLERNFPLGRITSEFEYLSPEEAYGPGFDQASIEQRKDMILRAKERNLVDAYGPIEPTGTAATIGEITGTLADPINLLPFGRGAKALIGSGALYGASYSALEDYAIKGEIDPKKALALGAFGAATGGVFAGGGALINKAQRKAANRRITEVEQQLNQHIVDNAGTPFGAFASLSPKQLAQLRRDTVVAQRQPVVKETSTKAEQFLRDSIVNDSAVSRIRSPAVDKFIGSLSTRMGNISQPVLRRFREMDFNTHRRTKEYMERVAPFMRDLQKLKPDAKKSMGFHLANNDFVSAEQAMSKPMKQNFRETVKVLEELFDDSVDAGLMLSKMENYFPRLVNDYDKLAAELRFTGKSDILTKAYKKWADSQKPPRSVDSLTMTEKAKIANLALRGYDFGKVKAGTPNFAKQRKFSKLEFDTYEKFYHQPEHALQMYIRNSVHNQERRKALGQTDAAIKTGLLNVDESIGKLVAKEEAAGRLDPNNSDLLKELMGARLIGGEKSPSNTIGILRDLGYMGTIANPISALTQLGDIGVSMAKYGFRNTIASMFKTKDLKVIDIGLERAGQEFADVRKSSQVLDKLMGVSGFKMIDRLGKETIMNAALRNNFKLAQTPAGQKKIRQEWGKFYGDDMDTLISELKSGEVTELVKFHGWNEISNLQPVSSLELPQGYLENPNGRILYSLQSFTLKQLDVARRDVVQQWNKGNKKQATKNALALAGYMSAAGVTVQTVKDILLGRDVKPEDLPENAMWSLTSVYGLNRYTTEKYLQQGKFTDAAFNIIQPPVPILEMVQGTVTEATKEDPDFAKYTRSIPVVGPMFYNWFGGGAEKYNERLRDQ